MQNIKYVFKTSFKLEIKFNLILKKDKSVSLSESNYSQVFCSGILGSIELITGLYLIIITNKQKIGTLMGNDIWKLEEIKMLPYREKEMELNESEVPYIIF